MTTWVDSLRSVAPSLAGVVGTLAGGPIWGAALSQLSTAVLGKPDGTKEEIEEAVTKGLGPDQIVALKKNEQDFLLAMEAAKQAGREIDLRETQAYIADTSDARHVYSADSRVFWLGIAVLATFLVLMASIIWGCFALVTGERVVDSSLVAVIAALIGSIAGYVAANAQQVVSYFFGSSKGSKDSGEAVRRALDTTSIALKDAQSKQS